MSADVYYFDPPKTVQDHARRLAAHLTIIGMSRLDFFGRWDCFDELRWTAEGFLEELFSIWHSNTPESLQMVINGEMPLEHVSDWEKSQIIDFDDTEWGCMKCGNEWCAWQRPNGLCECGGSLYLGWSDPCPEPPPTLQSPLFLTERRVA